MFGILKMHYLKFPGEHSLQVLDSENLINYYECKIWQRLCGRDDWSEKFQR